MGTVSVRVAHLSKGIVSSSHPGHCHFSAPKSTSHSAWYLLEFVILLTGRTLNCFQRCLDKSVKIKCQDKVCGLKSYLQSRLKYLNGDQRDPKSELFSITYQINLRRPILTLFPLSLQLYKPMDKFTISAGLVAPKVTLMSPESMNRFLRLMVILMAYSELKFAARSRSWRYSIHGSDCQNVDSYASTFERSTFNYDLSFCVGWLINQL